jgi:hypothetical protein
MFFSNKKENQDKEKNALRILDVIFVKTEHNGHFSTVKFGSKNNVKNMSNNILFLVVLTWLRQHQQYFYKLLERSDYQNWSNYGNYCGTPSNQNAKIAPLDNIHFAKAFGGNPKVQVPHVNFFRPNKNHKGCVSLEEWALQILKPDVEQAMREALQDKERPWNDTIFKPNLSPKGEFKISNKNFANKANAKKGPTNDDFNRIKQVQIRSRIGEEYQFGNNGTT